MGTRLQFLAVMAMLLAGCGGGEPASGPTPPPPPTVATVTVTPDSAMLRLGDSVQLGATLRDGQGATMSGPSVTWASANPTIATVSTSGLVTAVGLGRAEVTATAGGRIGRAVVIGRPVADSLEGMPTGLAGNAIPMRSPPNDTSSYRTGHPDFPEMSVSVSVLKVLVTPAATVAEVNTLLQELRAEIVGGVPGGSEGGLLILRLPTVTHQGLDSARTHAAGRPFVGVAVADVRLEGTVLPGPNSGTPAQWTWGLLPSGDNYGLELIRAPQMWNLNTVIRRRGGAVNTELGIFDAGFGTHDDLVVLADRSGGVAHDHGLHVAGTAAGTINNGRGVDGVTPYADLVIAEIGTMGGWVTGLGSLIAERPGMRVVNVSLGYNWRSPSPPRNTNTDASAAARQQAILDGIIVDWSLQRIARARGPNSLPVILAAAGNDSRLGVQQAKYASPFNAAALISNNKAIIVVESVDSTRLRSPFSNVNGHVSAPGSAIMSLVNSTVPKPGEFPISCTTGTNCYQLKSGTSMATPHVAGLVTYLYSLAPGLPGASPTANPVLDLLLANTRVTTGGAAPMVDAFFVAMDLDRVEGGDRILRGLLDIDDGSPDGNLRITAQGAIETSEDLDGDGYTGDGAVDMSDFRRFRDALLLVEQPAGLGLNGDPAHSKRDLNRDGTLGTPVQENVYPRADFNGDGSIDRTATRLMRGALGGQILTDLAVLQSRFSDPHYPAGQLPNLLDSGDISVLLAQCAGPPGVANLRLQARLQGGAQIVEQRTVPRTDVLQILTLPAAAAGYTVTVEALDASGALVGTDQGDLSSALGGDAFFGPTCTKVEISTTPASLRNLALGVVTPVTILVQLRDPATGALTPAASAALTLSLTNGSLSSTSGTTDAQGQAVVGLTWVGPMPGVLTVEARSPDGPSGTVQFPVGFVNDLSISGGPSRTAVLGVPFLRSFTANGGTGSYAWSIVSGALPGGLGLSGSGQTAAITGTPSGSPASGSAVLQLQSGTMVTQALVGIGVQLDKWAGGYEGTVTTPTGPEPVYVLITSYSNGQYTMATTWRSIGCLANATQNAATIELASCAGNGSNGATLTWGLAPPGADGIVKRRLTGVCRNCAPPPTFQGTRQDYDLVLTER